MSNVNDKSVYIFDLDGTLYSQPKTRFAMARNLLCYYLIRVHKLKELKALYLFRKYREKPEFCKSSMKELYEVLSDKVSLGPSDVEGVIDKWMFVEPLRILKKYAYTSVIEFIKNAQENNKEVIIYSDYPVCAKLEALGIAPDLMFTSEDENIQELKPSKKAMELILGSISVSKDKVMYIGDRDDKDRASAKLADISYCDIDAFRKAIK